MPMRQTTKIQHFICQTSVLCTQIGKQPPKCIQLQAVWRKLVIEALRQQPPTEK